MVWAFLRYFTRYIFASRTRQRPLFIAMLGLFLSAFALLVIQSIMGGLQHSLVMRSKSIEGVGVINLSGDLVHDSDRQTQLVTYLEKTGLLAIPEYEIELLLRNKNYISPVLIHGMDVSPEGKRPLFLKEKDMTGLVLGSEMSSKVRSDFMNPIMLISPAHTNELMGDIPRQVTTSVSDLAFTNVPEIDAFHGWTRLSLIHNLIQDRAINRVRLYGTTVPVWSDLRASLTREFGHEADLLTWDETHSALVWSLALETRVMLGLFIAMTALVAISITVGLMIFFGKIRFDLMSFWILGCPMDRLHRMARIYLHVLSGMTCGAGLLVAWLFLIALGAWGGNLMPAVFIERGIPVLITVKGVAIAFLVPYLISIVFSHFSLISIGHSEESFLSEIRNIG